MIAKQYNLILQDVFFAEKMGFTPIAALSYLLIARAIERIADHAKKLASNVENIHTNNKIISNIIEVSTKISAILDAAMNAFYAKRFEETNNVVNAAKKISKSINKLRHDLMEIKENTLETVSFAYILDSLERIRSYASDIAEISINQQFAKEL